MKTIIPCLWFKDNALEAINHYVSVFPDSKIINKFYNYENNPYAKEWDLLSLDFELSGNHFQAINWWVVFEYNYSVSFEIPCKDQKEIDYYYDKLSSDPEAEQCGWIKDKFWVSWQIVPENLDSYLLGPKEKSSKVMKALLEMKRIDIAALEKAYNS